LHAGDGNLKSHFRLYELEDPESEDLACRICMQILALGTVSFWDMATILEKMGHLPELANHLPEVQLRTWTVDLGRSEVPLLLDENS
jgi:hypothetical protein